MKEISVHIIRTETVRETDCTLLSECMPHRFEKAFRYRREKDRLLSLGAGLLLMNVLGIRDESVIRYGDHGKPFVPGMHAFSLSHSGSFCILASGGAENIGADIEEINERHTSVAPEVFTERELAWMREKDPTERFFRLWTWKESVMKAAGMGLGLAPRSFEVLPFAENKPALVMDRLWYPWEDRIENCRISVCADEPVERVNVIEIYGV